VTEPYVVCILAVALLVTTVAGAVLAVSVPYLWHRAFKLSGRLDEHEKQLKTLDEALAAFMGAAGVPAEHGGDK
jgi:hypothetical protein